MVPVTPPPAARDLALLLARIGLGVVFLAHGWRKLRDGGVDGTAAGFAATGVPAPQASAWFATVVELVGGGLLVLGVLVPLVGLLLFLDMVGALVFVHAGSGVFVADGGWELVVALGVGSLVVAASGSGRYGADGLLTLRRR